jgi:hypothetical protein
MRSLLTLVLLSGLIPSISAQTRVFGYRGVVPGAQSLSISTMSLRSDGRYLFYSTGASYFQALDMLDMATIGDTATATNDIVFNVSLTNDTHLTVATASGVQYFNVQYPFAPTEEGTRYPRPSGLSVSVQDACVGPSGKTYFLERGTTSNSHLVRSVQGSVAGSDITWSNIFGPRSPSLSPLAIRCGKQNIFVIANYVNDSGVETEYWVAMLDGAGNAVSRIDLWDANSGLGSQASSAFSRIDFVMHPKKDQLLFLFNKKNSTSIAFDNSKVITVPPSSTVNVGSDAQFLASFVDSTSAFTGLFLKYDWAHYADNAVDNTYKFLFSAADAFTSLCNDSPRSCYGDVAGTGYTTAITPPLHTIWASSASDHYKIGNMGTSGLILISKAPSLQFTTNPMSPIQSLSASRPLAFTLTSDADLTLEMRVDEDADRKGSSYGITKIGKTVTPSTGSLDLRANTPTVYRMTVADLALIKNQTNSITIFGTDGSQNALLARTGFTFSYDPPPGSVLNFKTGWGDQSAAAFFDLPKDADIQTVLIYFSYDASSLDSLPTDADGLTRATTTIATVNGGTLTSPAQVDAATWAGRYVISPITNGRTIYIRPALIDKGGQYSENNAAALTAEPGRTRTVAEALGSPASCALDSHAEQSRTSFFLWIIFAVICGVLRFEAKKLGPALLRNRRGGD